MFTYNTYNIHTFRRGFKTDKHNWWADLAGYLFRGFVVGGFDTGRGLLVSKVLHGSWAEQKGLKDRRSCGACRAEQSTTMAIPGARGVLWLASKPFETMYQASLPPTVGCGRLEVLVFVLLAQTWFTNSSFHDSMLHHPYQNGYNNADSSDFEAAHCRREMNLQASMGKMWKTWRNRRFSRLCSRRGLSSSLELAMNPEFFFVWPAKNHLVI